jgi:hypothetical protein
VEALDARLVELVRSGAPLRRALARVAGAFVSRKAWEPLGFARPADYARERPGLSGRELHDLAHVDAALARLPAIDSALGSGQLGWTKARLLCRVATPEDEVRWLAAAGQLSAIRLEVDPGWCPTPRELVRRRSGMSATVDEDTDQATDSTGADDRPKPLGPADCREGSSA